MKMRPKRGSPQRIHAFTAQGERSALLPPVDDEIFPGIPWGRCDAFLTPAFWAERYWHLQDELSQKSYRLGTTLSEEVVACLLGGHGLPAAVGIAAYHRLRSAGLCVGQPSADVIESQLRLPLHIDQRFVRYRFPRQRSGFIAAALAAIATNTIPHDDIALRDFLDALPGIGPKTASWITRNWLDSDRVAIIDVHIQRACRLAGIFPHRWNPTQHYRAMEQRFLQFATLINAKSSQLDHLMWHEMRLLARYASRVDGYQASA